MPDAQKEEREGRGRVNLCVTANIIESDINSEMVRNVIPMVVRASSGPLSIWLPQLFKLYTP